MHRRYRRWSKRSQNIAERLNKTQINEETHEAQMFELFFKISEYVYFTEAQLTYNVPGAQHGDSATYIHMYHFSDHFPL